MASKRKVIQKLKDYNIELACENDKQIIFEFIKNYFFTEEPLSISLSKFQGTDPVPKDFTIDTVKCIDEGLSLLAVKNDTEIIGAIENAEIQSTVPPNNEEFSNTNRNQIRTLLRHIYEQSKLFKILPNSSQKEMDVFTLTVHPDWRNKGVGTHLLNATRDLAMQKNFAQLRSICTNAYSAKLFSNCGFECVYTVKYEEWKNEGKLDFLPSAPHTHIRGMVLTL